MQALKYGYVFWRFKRDIEVRFIPIYRKIMVEQSLSVDFNLVSNNWSQSTVTNGGNTGTQIVSMITNILITTWANQSLTNLFAKPNQLKYNRSSCFCIHTSFLINSSSSRPLWLTKTDIYRIKVASNINDLQW